MKKETLISVIIPVYNIEKYLSRCISSIVNQTYKNLEIILIDDGSTDKSLKICKDWEKKDNRVKVISQENRGVSSARNKGLSIAKGGYISFIDGDDEINIDLYDSFTDQYNLDIDIIRFRCQTQHGRYKFNSAKIEDNLLFFDNTKKQKYSLFLKKHLLGSVCYTIFNRKVIANLTFEGNYKYGEDYLFYFQVLENCKSIYFSNKILYYYKVNNYSATRKKNKNQELKKIFDHYNVDYYVYKYINDHNLNELIATTLECTYLATVNWLKNLAKNYSYKDYSKLISQLINSKEYKRYIGISDNCNVKLIEVMMKNKKCFYYIKYKIIGIAKEIVKFCTNLFK